MIRNLLNTPDVNNNPQFKEYISNAADVASSSLEKLNALVTKPNMDFFKIAQALQKSAFSIGPILKQIPPYISSQQYQNTYNSLMKALANTLKVIPPTIEDCKGTIRNYLPILKDVSNLFKLHLNNPKVIQSPKAKETLDDWLNDALSSIQILDNHLKDPNYNEHTANEDKNIMLKLLDKYSTIPPHLRKCLDQPQIEELAKLLGRLAEAAHISINCIRQLPGLKRPKSDPSKFTKIENYEELDESIPNLGEQINSLRQFYQELTAGNTLYDRPNALKLTKEISNQLAEAKLEFFKPDADENQLCDLLQRLKDKMQFIISSSELISPIIRDQNIGRNTKIVNDNINTVLQILNNPHLDKKSAKEFLDIILPILKKIQPETQTFMLRSDVTKVPQLTDLLKNFSNVLALSLSTFTTAKPRKMQMLLDDLYQSISLLLPSLQENPDHEKYLQLINQLFDILSGYTSLQQVQIRYSDVLKIKNPVISDKSIKEIAELAFTALEPRNAEIDEDIFNHLSDNLNIINDHKESVPAYIGYASSLLTPVINNHEIPIISDSIRTIISCASSAISPALYEQLAVKTSVLAATKLNQLIKSLSFLQQQIEQYPNMFDDETKFYLSKLDAAIKRSDPSLLIQCQSLPTAVFNYQPMRNIENALQLLLNKVSSIPQIKPIVQPLQDCGKEFSSWIFQSDLAMMGYFQSHLDEISVVTEELSTMDKKKALPKSVSKFIRDSISDLKIKDRGITYDMNVISRLANLSMAYQKDIYPIIVKSFPKEVEETRLSSHLQALEKIRPIIKNWLNPIEGLTLQGIRSNVMASLTTSISSTNQLNDQVDKDPSLVEFDFVLGSAKISSLLLNLSKALDKKINVKDVYSEALKVNDPLRNIKEPGSFKNVQKLKLDIDSLNKYLVNTKDVLNKSIPIDYNSVDEIDFDSDMESMFAMIGDQDSLNFAKEVAKYLNEILASIPKLSNEKRTLGTHKYDKLIDLKLSNGKLIQLPFNSNKIQGIEQKLSDPIIPIDLSELDSILSKMTLLLSDSRKSSTDKQNSALAQFERTLLGQRISQLQQQQISEFPDVVKSISSLNSKLLPNSTLSSEQIDSSMNSIKDQFESMAGATELKKVQKHHTPEQIFGQQVLLTHNLEQAIDRAVDLPIRSHVEQINNINTKLFEAVLDQIQTLGIPENQFNIDNISSIIQKGYSQISLINKLITIQQQLSVNVPDIFKFVPSPEGLQLLNSPITSHQLLEQQQNILKQINLASSSEMLNAFQKNLLPEQIIIQQRVLQNLLNLLTGDYGKQIMSENTNDTSPSSILASVNLLQQAAVKENPDVLKLQFYINPQDTLNVQQFTYELMNRLSCLQKISEIQTTQLACNSNSQQISQKLEQNATINTSEVKTQRQSLISQYSNPDQIVQVSSKLSQNDLLQQQQILAIAANIISNPTILAKYCSGVNLSSDLNSLMIQLFDELQNQQKQLLHSSIKSLDGIKPLNDSQIMKGFEKSNDKIMNLNRIQQMKFLLSSIKLVNPSLATAKPVFTQDQLELSRAILQRLIDLSSTNPLMIKSFIKDLGKDDQQRVYSLILSELSKLNSYDPIDDEFLRNQSHIFDTAALIQRQPVVGIVAASTKDFSIQKLDEIDSKIKGLKESIIINGVQNNLVQLMYARIQLNPNLANVTDSSSALENIKPSEIEKLSQSLIQQLSMVKDCSALSSELEKLDKDQLVIQQLMLQQMTLDSSKESKQIILKGIDFNLIDSNVHSALSKCSQQLIEAQKTKLKTSLQLLTPIKLPSQIQLKAALRLTNEQFIRGCVCHKLENIQSQMLKGINGLNNYVHSSSYETAISDPFNQEEVIDYQDMIRTLITLNSSAEDINRTYQKQTPQTNSRSITVLSNLSQIILPPNINVSEEIEKGNVSQLQSFFDKSINYGDLLVGPIPEIQIPSEKLNATRVATASHSLIALIPTMSNISIDECKSILTTENKEALSIINSIYESKSTNYSKSISSLLEITPQLVGSYARVAPKLKDNVKKQLNLHPLNILKSVEKLQKASCLKSSADSAVDFRKTLADLLSSFCNIDSAISVRKDEDSITRTVSCFASMAKAIQHQDIDLLNKEIIQFNGLNVSALSFGTNNPHLKAINPQIQKIQPLVSQSYSLHGKLSSELSKSMNEFRNSLVEIINKETKDPFSLIEGIKTATEVQEIVTKSRKDISSSTSDLIDSVQRRNKAATASSISDIIESISTSISAALKGLDVTKCQNNNIYYDCSRIFDSSMVSMRSIIEILKSSAVSSTAIRRSTRSFNRMLSSIYDIMEDVNAPSYTKKPSSQIDNAKLSFIQSISKGYKLISTTITARAMSKIPETFEKLFKPQIANLDKIFSELTNKSNEILKLNTDKAAAEQFSKEVETFNLLYNKLKTDSQDMKLNQNDDALIILANDFMRITDSLNLLVVNMSKLTDEIPIAPDLENAEKLKRRYEMPSVPSDIAGLKVPDAVKKLNTLISTYDNKVKAFFDLFPKGAKNNQLADSMNQVYNSIDEVVKQILRISSISMNLELQGGLTGTCSSIAKSYDLLLKELRSKFMLSGDWNGKSPKYREDIKSALEETQKLAQKASEIAEEEARVQSAKTAKFTKVLNPLSEIKTTMEKTNEKVKKLDSSITREYSSRMLDIGISLSASLNHLVLHTKAHNIDGQEVDSMLGYTESMIDQFKSLVDDSKEITTKKLPEPETKVIQRMNIVYDKSTEFIKCYKFTSSEEKVISESISTVCKGAKALATSAENSLKNKRIQKEKAKSGARTPASRVTVTKESLLKRLELESRVIRARIILEKSEKRLEDFINK